MYDVLVSSDDVREMQDSLGAAGLQRDVNGTTAKIKVVNIDLQRDVKLHHAEKPWRRLTKIGHYGVITVTEVFGQRVDALVIYHLLPFP